MTQNKRFHRKLILFCLLLTVYTLTNSGTFHIIDEVSLFAVTESVAQRGEVDTNVIAWSQWVNSPGEVLGAFGPDGEVYSKKGPAPAFFAVPWTLLMRLWVALGLPWGLLQGALLWNGLLTAATAVLLWSTAERLGYGERTGSVLALIFGLGTIAWPYANHLFGEPLSALGILLCFYAMLRPAAGKSRLAANAEDDMFPASRNWQFGLVAGLGAAVVIATVTAHVLLIAVFGIYLLWALLRTDSPLAAHRPTVPRTMTHAVVRITAFALPLLIMGLLLLLYNAARFGDPFDTGYHFDSGEGFTTPFLQGFWGLMGSPYRGVFWHTPVLVLSVLAFPAFVRRHRAEGLLIAALSLVLVTMYSLWWMWWGGFAWGPRFLVPLTPLWILLLAPVLERVMSKESRIGAWKQLALPMLYALLIALSFLVQLSSVVVNYVNYEIRLREIFPTDWTDPLRFGPPAQGLADLIHSPVIGQWRLMADNFIANSDLVWLWPDGTVQWSVVMAGALALTVVIGIWRSGAGDWGKVGVLAITAAFLAVWLSAAGRHPIYAAPGYRAILAEVGLVAGDDDAVLTIAPYHYQIPMNWFNRGLPIFGYATDSMDHPETAAVLTAALAQHPQIWYVSAGLAPFDPANTVERWLADHAFKADDRWFDDFRLVRYATDHALAGADLLPLDVALSDEANRVELTGVRLPPVAGAGSTLPVAIHFRVDNAIAPLHWFVQLLGPDGVPAALLDTAPLDGYASFAELPVAVDLLERAGLALPADAASGQYQLIAGIYDPTREDAPRLRTQGGGDFVKLGIVEIP